MQTFVVKTHPLAGRIANARGIRMRSLLAGICLLAATTAAADWPAGGLLVQSPPATRAGGAQIFQVPGGDLFVLGVGTCLCNDAYFNMQRVSVGGVLAPGWPASGVALTGVLGSISQSAQSIFVDDGSRTWHAWPGSSFGTSFLQSIAGDGTPAPAPETNSYNLGSGATTHAAPASGGEVFVTCGSSILKRLTPAGTPAADWTASGLDLPGPAFDDNALLSDGNGGVIVFLRESQGTLNSFPIALRVPGSGAPDFSWGLQVSHVSQPPDFVFDSQLLPSGSDHFLAVWTSDAGSGQRRLTMQRFRNDGTLDPAWPVNGLLVVAPTTLGACRAIPDGSDGAYVLREYGGSAVGTHVTGAGTFLGGSNVPLLDGAAEYLPTDFADSRDGLIADHTPDGGLLLGWNDTRLAPAVSFRLRWLTPSLTAAPGKPDTGVVVFPSSPHPYDGSLLALRADGPDAAFIAWGDYHGDGSGQRGDVWMNRVQGPALVGVEPPAGPAARLALSAPRPNPARDAAAFDLTLPDDSPARIELLDVAGRVLRAQVAAGAGVHAVAFARLQSLAPGLYFARATSRSGVRSVRIVVSR